MPIYLFKCQNPECSIIHEKLLSLSESDSTPECPECSMKSKRTFSGNNPAVKYNGSGFTRDYSY